MKKKKKKRLESAARQLVCNLDLMLFGPLTGENIPYYSLNGQDKALYDAMNIGLYYIVKMLNDKHSGYNLKHIKKMIKESEKCSTA